MLLIYVALIGSAGWLLVTTSQGFIPAQDRGYVIISAQLPGAASLARTTEVVREIERIALDTPGIVRVAAFAGFSGATRTQAGNAAALFPVFEEPEVRLKKGLTAKAITAESAQAACRDPGRLHHRHSAAGGAWHRHRRRLHHAHPGSPGPRTGAAGGRDRRTRRRGAQVAALLAPSVFSPFSANTPQVFVDIDRIKAQKLGVPIQNITDTIETYFGSTYVNDFNLFGRTYHVTAQADLPFRKETRRSRAAAHPQCQRRHGDARQRGGFQGCLRARPRRALQSLSGRRAAGRDAAGYQLGDRDHHHEELADETLPSGFSYEWTDLSYQQVTGGNAGLYVFPICVLFVYLVLAAQYGSWTLPFAVILIVPMCLLAATIGVRIMGQDINILTQIGFVVLVGLAAKNAILIVEFARDIEQEGKRPAGGGDRGLPPAAAADPDDVVRLHPRRAAAGGVDGLRLGDASGGRRRRVLRHARRDAVRPDLHADLLHGGAQPRGRQERGQADSDKGGRGGVSCGDADARWGWSR